jgi:hypothetical protein
MDSKRNTTPAPQPSHNESFNQLETEEFKNEDSLNIAYMFSYKVNTCIGGCYNEAS